MDSTKFLSVMVQNWVLSGFFLYERIEDNSVFWVEIFFFELFVFQFKKKANAWIFKTIYFLDGMYMLKLKNIYYEICTLAFF